MSKIKKEKGVKKERVVTHCNLQPATCNLQPATCNLQPATTVVMMATQPCILLREIIKF
jgi:hypothetical protein